MALFRDNAIVLRRLDYSETSQVLFVFCRETGPQRMIAKGIKRGTKTRVAVGVDLLESGAVVYSRRPGSDAQLATMTEWRQTDAHSHLRRDLLRLYTAQYAAEVTAQLVEAADPHPALFDAVSALMNDLAGARPLRELTAYLLVLLREIGLVPQFDACAACGAEISPRDPGIYFSSRQGGTICRDCEPAHVEKRRVDPRALPVLRGSDGDDAAVICAFDILDYHLRETMGREARLSGPLREQIRLAYPTTR